MAHFYEAAEAAAVSGDGEMAFFYAAAAAAATITGGAKAGAYFGSLANGGHVDDATEVEDEPVRTSRLGRRQVAGADGTTGSLLNKRREAETLGVSGLRRKNVDTGPMPLDITAADMAELMSQQIAQNTTVEMVELAQQMALSTLGDIGQQAEEGARKSPLSPHQSPRSPGRKAGGSRRKSGGQENMTSPKVREVILAWLFVLTWDGETCPLSKWQGAGGRRSHHAHFGLFLSLSLSISLYLSLSLSLSPSPTGLFLLLVSPSFSLVLLVGPQEF